MDWRRRVERKTKVLIDARAAFIAVSCSPELISLATRPWTTLLLPTISLPFEDYLRKLHSQQCFERDTFTQSLNHCTSIKSNWRSLSVVERLSCYGLMKRHVGHCCDLIAWQVERLLSDQQNIPFTTVDLHEMNDPSALAKWEASTKSQCTSQSGHSRHYRNDPIRFQISYEQSVKHVTWNETQAIAVVMIAIAKL